MSEILRALILGIIQGLTEFLPVSSSGHLELINHLWGEERAIDSDLMLVLIVHVGTALSILYVFRGEILALIKGGLQFKKNDESRMILELALSMIPAVFVGLLFEDEIEQLFEGGILLVGVCLIVTGLVLWLTPNRAHDDEGNIGWKRSLAIGLAQAIAILPGISRSGMTIATALMLGVSKKQAAQFSFLMVLPVIFGKLFLDILSGDFGNAQLHLPSMLVALLASFIVGVWACKWMIALVRSFSLKYFSIYCLSIGLVTVALGVYG